VAPDDHVDFLRRRIREFLFVILVFAVGALVSPLANVVVAKEVDESLWGPLAGILTLLLFIALHTRLRSRRALGRFEFAAVLVGSAHIMVWSASTPDSSGRQLYLLTFLHVARAIYVPSSARRTLLLAAITGVGVAAMTLMQVSFSQQCMVKGSWAAAEATVTWVTAAFLATSTSKVIYGLRQEVHDARQLGQYTLGERLGEGGMGIVHRAHHAILRRPTAIKLLSGYVDEISLSRFEREARAAASLTHPNTITIFDYGRTPEGTFYYAMELLDGVALDQLVAIHGAQPPERVLHILDQIVAALSEAHGVGLIHRDIKPANVMLSTRGGVPDVTKVLDFGLVKIVEATNGPDRSHPEAIMGTPLYMSPEAIRTPAAVDARSDIYAVGALGYYLLTGQHVFDGEVVADILSHHLRTIPERPSKRLGRTLPTEVEEVVLACLAKDPKERPQTAIELRQQLRRSPMFGTWTEERALAWWALRQATTNGSPGRTVVTPRTIEIDVTQRVASSATPRMPQGTADEV
jgi:serine/threonine-protein kinase